MSQQTEFFLARAADERGKADQSGLVNVRNNHLRAAEAWDVLAQRALRSDRLRTEEEARKAQVAQDMAVAQEMAAPQDMAV